MIDTPYQGKGPSVRAAHALGVTWCADNGAFTDRWDENTWWLWLLEQSHLAPTCAFATAPDVVGDAWRTLIRSRPWLHPIRRLGYPVAYVAQDGIDQHPIPWHDFDVLFLGGTTDWKLGPVARQVTADAIDRGKQVHMGRVNSERRYEYARAIGCSSVDGTYLVFGPDQLLPGLLAWGRNVHQPPLF